MAKVKREDIHKQPLDKRKIILGLVSLVFLIGIILYSTKTTFLGDTVKRESVKGIQTSTGLSIKRQLPAFSIQSTVEDKVNSIRDEVSKLDVKEVASTSPQVQKVLNDIKSMQNYPRNQAKEACRQVCDKL